MRALLDVNVLIALLDAHHTHHVAASAWLERHLHLGWASCPLTQNGCIRILSQPRYPNPVAAAEVAARLAEACAQRHHAFWPDDLSIVEPGALEWSRLLGGRHLTDAYLLALAVRHGGRLVTLDRGIPLDAVADADSRHLVVIQ